MKIDEMRIEGRVMVHYGNIRVEVGEANDPNFYSFELLDSGDILGGPFCKVTETTIAGVRGRLKALLDPEKTC